MPDEDSERRAQRRIARKYRVLGYDVQEQPAADHLPAFLHGVAPDLIARDGSDHVVIQVKRNAALKGSNDLIHLAALVSGQPGWRFELVVLDDRETEPAADAEIDVDRAREKVTAAINAGLVDIAHVYLADILVRTARDLAEIHRVRSDNKSDRDLFADLALRGILPQALLQQCLDALAAREDERAPAADLDALFYLCEQLQAGLALSRRHRS